ncbi:endonuclease G [Candidatus Electrothrix aarhusensis]|uniref:Endonuclease G n=1 Tax=Candidatus Electrothrix aarhusensis TaxID=1859131 RepID=A0A444IQ96_9BACT|nr:endonuclease G [Candidatus Electrothrix aarhusensis]
MKSLFPMFQVERFITGDRQEVTACLNMDFILKNGGEVMNGHSNLRNIFADKKVMEEIQNRFGSGSGKTELESAVTDGSLVNLDVLLDGNESALSPGDAPTTQLEAIIEFIGRPPLLIQDGEWETPVLDEVRQRVEQNKEGLLQAIPKVGRVEILGIAKYRPFIGTAWMIDEDVMVTNRHVAELFATRIGNHFTFRHHTSGGPYQVQVDFLREHERTAEFQARIKEVIFLEESSSVRPDMALVRLDGDGLTLPEPLLLDGANPSFDMDIAVIGYPAQDSRSDFFRMERIFNGIYNVKRLSPGKVKGVDFDGKRLLHDCTTLGGNSGSCVLNAETGRVCGLHFAGEYRVRNYAVSVGWLKSRLAEINGSVSVAFQGLPGLPNPDLPVPPPVEAVTNKEGYDPDFLQADIPVSLPTVPDRDLIAPAQGSDDGVLRYTHFSIVMHKERRLPFFTACNINGGLLYKIPRGQDHWRLDERLEDHENRQTGEGLYRNNPLDRGHLVRRLDPAWGETREEAKQAEQDTFFFTNCAPQHSRINRGAWLSLEDYVLSNTGTHDLKVCVFTGPVLAETDPEYRGVLIPREFWKVLVVRNTFTGQLSVAAYLLSQAEYLGDLEFVFGEFRTYQVPLSVIEGKTGLRFGELADYDSMQSIEGIPYRIISSGTDIVI